MRHCLVLRVFLGHQNHSLNFHLRYGWYSSTLQGRRLRLGKLKVHVGFATPDLFRGHAFQPSCAPSDTQVLLRRCMGEPEVFQSVAGSLQM